MFPNIRNAKWISFDIETKDPEIATYKWKRPGHITGVAVAAEGGFKQYYPFHHLEGGNVDIDAAMAWLRDMLSGPALKYGTNLPYDIEWLDIDVKGPFWDVSMVEALIDENGHYSLNSLAKKYLNEKKSEDGLYLWLANNFGGAPDRRSQAKNIWRASVSVLHEYVMSDVTLPPRIAEEQRRIVQSEDLNDIVALEMGLMPMFMAMRRQGVRVDEKKLEDVSRQLDAMCETLRGKLGDVDPYSGKSIAKYFDKQGLHYERTEKGNPSFTAEFLASVDDPIAKTVTEFRKADKLRGTFIEGHIKGHLHNGRVHGTFNQLKGDEYGTVSGRISMSNPNLQQIPSADRDPVFGALIRSLFIPDDGHEWVKMDYSQIEPRLTLHYCKADGIKEMYRQNPKMDCYAPMVQSTGLSRKAVKGIYLGLIYGMGIPTLSTHLKVDMDTAQVQYDNFCKGVPHIIDLTERVKAKASGKGVLRTIGGRRARFPDKSLVFKALNRLIQGGAADILKKAMLDMWNQGLPVPMLQVHDELDFSLPKDSDVVESIVNCMKHPYKLSVPLDVDIKKGPTWQ